MSGSSMNPELAKTLHFFRIILDQTQKMALPKRFVSIYGNDLSNIVILRAPSGREWHVELMKCDREIWLSNGWKDFADYFRLKYGNLLIFRYEGHSRFYVFMIFDQTTFEIEYPIDISTSSKNGNHDVEEIETPKVEEVESDDSVEIVGNISRSRKTKEKPPLPRFSPRKRTRAAASIVMQGTGDVKKPEFRMTRRYGSKKINPKEAGGGTSAVRVSSTSSRANCFGSENLSFIVILRKSHIKGNYLHIPVAFVRNSWTRKEAKVVVLKDQDGETWPVRLVVEKKIYLGLGYGWMAFARDKDLHVGDSCAFELFEEPEISFKVTVLRNIEDSNDHHTGAHGSKTGHARRQRKLNMQSRSECDYYRKDEVIRSSLTSKESDVPRRIKTKNRRFVEANTSVAGRAVQRISSKGIARALERVSEFRSVHPFFKLVTTAYFLQVGNPIIPFSFCDEHFERLPEDVTLKFKGKSWPLRIVYCSDKRSRLGAGWRAFASENKLKVGDVCVFEVIKKTNIVFKVSIFKDDSTLGVNRC